VKNPRDVSAVIGAIRAGKMKPENAPPYVRQVMEDMKKKGIDPNTANQKDIQKIFRTIRRRWRRLAVKDAVKSQGGTSRTTSGGSKPSGWTPHQPARRATPSGKQSSSLKPPS
jgi:hypothetical protein